jgi:hypothetical protein
LPRILLTELDSDQVSDSQASQILRDALGGESLGNIQHPEDSISEDISSILGEQSFGTRGYPSETNELNYHLHGLAPTQTQDAYPDTPSNLQKENTPTTSAHKERNESLFAPPKANSTRPHADPLSRPYSRNAVSGVKNINEMPRNARHPSSGKFVTSKNKAVGTPQQPPANFNSKQTSQSQNSAGSTSQDSFVGFIPPEDRERQFLSSTKQFGIPLSEIGRSTSTSGDIPDKSADSSIFYSRMSSSGVEGRIPTGPAGKILVEDSDGRQTQSSKAESQQSHGSNVSQLGHSQFEMTHKQPEEATFELPADISQSSREDSQPGSSYARMLEGDYPQEFTQDMEPTQPSGEQGEISVNAPDVTDANDFLSPANYPNFSAPSAPSLPLHDYTSPTTTNEAGPGPRSLLRMINPAKQWKMDMLMAQIPPTNNPPVDTAAQDTQIVEEEGSFSIPGLASHPEERYAIAQRAPEADHPSDTQPVESNGIVDQPVSVPPLDPPPVPTAFGLMSPNRSAVVPESEPTPHLSPGNSSDHQTEASFQSSPSQPLIEVLKKAPPTTPPPVDLSEDEDDVPLAARAQASTSDQAPKRKEKNPVVSAPKSRVVQVN